MLSKVDIKNKKLALFCCHEGGLGKTLINMREELKNNTILANMDFVGVFNHKEDSSKKAAKWTKEIISL